jgi:cytochrome oxidase Cu insertion factor (SCO1/SenC/PrrC family)
MNRAALRRAVAVALLVPVLMLGLGACGGEPSAPSADFGTLFPKPRQVPVTPLVNKAGQDMSLASFRGKYVMLAPFLTLCQEECPLTTGVYQELQASVDKAGSWGQGRIRRSDGRPRAEHAGSSIGL